MHLLPHEETRSTFLSLNNTQKSTEPFCSFVGPSHPSRTEVETFVAQRFANTHNAVVSNFMPTLITLRDSHRRIQSVVGLRSAASEPLFLEHYLDGPIEQVIARQPIAQTAAPQRHEIVEVGNLASTNARTTRQLFRVLAAYMISQQHHWVVFTGCPALQRTLQKLQLPLWTLCHADPARLPATQQTWGSYYDDSPSVLVGEVRHGCVLVRHTSHAPCTKGA